MCAAAKEEVLTLFPEVVDRCHWRFRSRASLVLKN
jgi:hypothetical protein